MAALSLGTGRLELADEEPVVRRLTVGEDGRVTLPTGLSAAQAAFARERDDLRLSWPGERLFRVEGYFTRDPRPDLAGADGGRLPGALVAGLADPAASDAETPAGRLTVVEGAPRVSRHGEWLDLQRGFPVFAGDLLTVPDGGLVGLACERGPVVVLGGGARMAVDVPGVGGLFLLDGSCVTGGYGDQAPGRGLVTPVATVALPAARGVFDLTDGHNLTAVLLGEGRMLVANAKGTRTLTTPHRFTTCSAADQEPSAVGSMEAGDAESLAAGLLARFDNAQGGPARPTAKSGPQAEAAPEPKPEPEPKPKAEPEAAPKPEPKPEPKPQAKPEPETQAPSQSRAETAGGKASADKGPSVSAKVTPKAKPAAKPRPRGEPKPEAKPKAAPRPASEPAPQPEPAPPPKAKPQPAPAPRPEPKPEPKPAPRPETGAPPPAGAEDWTGYFVVPERGLLRDGGIGTDFVYGGPDDSVFDSADSRGRGKRG